MFKRIVSLSLLYFLGFRLLPKGRVAIGKKVVGKWRNGSRQMPTTTICVILIHKFASVGC